MFQINKFCAQFNQNRNKIWIKQICEMLGKYWRIMGRPKYSREKKKKKKQEKKLYIEKGCSDEYA